MKENKQKHSHSNLSLVKRYAGAAINLYGVIKLSDFIDLYNEYEDANIKKEEMVLLLKHITKNNLVLDMSFKYNILSNGFFYLDDPSDLKDARELIKVQSTKPRYRPLRKEFLKYSNEEYIEPLKPLLDLEKFIKDNKLVKIKKHNDIKDDLLQLHDDIVDGFPISDYFKYLNNRGYNFVDLDQLNIFTGFIQYIHNNTRMYQNNGHTPIEIRKLFENETIN